MGTSLDCWLARRRTAVTEEDESYVERGGNGEANAALPPPTPRDPTETRVVDFLVDFIAGISILVQPFGKFPACVANAFERTSRFGPVPNDTKKPAAFNARVDGCIPRGQLTSDNCPLVIFEAKRARRGENDITVRAQQTMEHAAFIWERYKVGSSPSAVVSLQLD